MTSLGPVSFSRRTLLHDGIYDKELPPRNKRVTMFSSTLETAC